MCIKVGCNSTARIYEDPWLPKASNFKVPDGTLRSDDFTLVRDLMNEARTNWDRSKVRSSFSLEICNLIHSIFLSDSIVWAPSKSETFSVRSSYRINNGARFGVQSA